MDQCLRCDFPLDAEEGEICDLCLEHGDFEDDDDDEWLDWVFEE